MKWKFDARTGTMVPEDKKEIYFGKSMSGGLRIDDHKNNVKYDVHHHFHTEVINESQI